MSYRTLVILSLLFSCIPVVGELFLWVSSGKFNPTIFAAAGLAIFLLGNLAALKFHKRLKVAQIVFCTVLTLGVTLAIAADGGIDSPLWFYQLLVIFGAGVVFGKLGSLVLGAYTLLMATAYYFASHLAGDSRSLAAFTSLIASSTIFTVISYLYQRDKELIAKQAENLSTANEELRQFAYRTSHDLKAPLISIRNLSELINEDLEIGDIDEAKQNAHRISKRARVLEKLVVDILDLAKADLANLPAEPIELHDIVKKIVSNWQTTVDKNRVSIEIDLTHTDNMVLPEVRVTQILENLISNAVRYCDPKERHPFLKISSVDEGEFVKITLLDNGLGIDEKFTDRLFEMFQRFHPAAASGSGLGLHIVKKHVDKLGASIDYHRTKDGSLFTLMMKRTIATP